MSNRITEAAEEALAIARGEIPAARLYHQGHFYVPESAFTRLTSEVERLRAALRDVLSYVPHGDMPVTIYSNARAALEPRT